MTTEHIRALVDYYGTLKVNLIEYNVVETMIFIRRPRHDRPLVNI